MTLKFTSLFLAILVTLLIYGDEAGNFNCLSKNTSLHTDITELLGNVLFVWRLLIQLQPILRSDKIYGIHEIGCSLLVSVPSKEQFKRFKLISCSTKISFILRGMTANLHTNQR